MASQNPNNPPRTPMYPQVMPNDQTTLNLPPSSSTRQNLYPTIYMNDLLVEQQNDQNTLPHQPYFPPSAPPEEEKIIEETLLTVPNSILHLIDQHYSVELAAGELSIHRLRQGDSVVAVLVRVGDEIQWPLTKDLVAVKLDGSHYFFSFRAPEEADGPEGKVSGPVDEPLSYGLTICSGGREEVVEELDGILVNCSNFTVQKVEENAALAFGGPVVERNGEVLEERCAAYWTTLAPNVEDYSAKAARLVASGSGKFIKGILWCGDVTSDRLKRGNEVLKNRSKTGKKSEVSPETLKRIKRVKRVTKMTEKVAGGVLSGVVKVSGAVTGSIANSKAGKKFFSLLPGEMVLATLDGFSRICDAVEVAGKNVMSTSSTVTTEFVSHRYGEEAAKATSEGLDAAGHAMGTAWAVFKLKKALNPKSALKPTTLAKSAAKAAAKAAAADKKTKSSK